jgi:putative ABC transport system permease protein
VKYLPLVWSGIWRKPGRTVLIFLQVAVAFALFGVLAGLKSGVDHAAAAARGDLLLVHSNLGLWGDTLPLGGRQRISSVPGVKQVEPVELFGTTYQKPDQYVGVVAIPPDEGWQDAFTYQISAASLAAFRSTRTGALVREELAAKYHWKIGDRIPLISTIAKKDGSTGWAFEVVGTYTDTDVGGGRDVIIINYTYYDEARASGTGTVNHFNVLIGDPKLATHIADQIDQRFANSSSETRTESLLEMAQAQLQAIGDLNFLVRAVIAAVLVALLFSTATMTMQSIRERIPELGVLKTIGFTDRSVFLLILSEATLVFVLAAACGLALANLLFPWAARFVPGLSMPPAVVGAGLAAAVLLALISTAAPATLAARLRIVTALTAR